MSKSINIGLYSLAIFPLISLPIGTTECITKPNAAEQSIILATLKMRQLLKYDTNSYRYPQVDLSQIKSLLYCRVFLSLFIF